MDKKKVAFNYAAFRGSVLDCRELITRRVGILSAPSRIKNTLYYPDGRIVKESV